MVRMVFLFLKSNNNVFFLQICLQLWYAYLSEVKYACRQCCVGMPQGEGVAEMVHLSCSTTGNDGDGQVVGQLCECLVGKALLHSVVVHGCEQDFSGTTFLNLMGPVKKPEFLTLASSLGVTMPAIGVLTGINSAYYYLGTEVPCYFVYQ